MGFGGGGSVANLPTRVSVSIVQEVLCDPRVDTGQGDFITSSFLHRHADESSVRVRGLHERIAAVVHAFVGVRVSRVDARHATARTTADVASHQHLQHFGGIVAGDDARHAGAAYNRRGGRRGRVRSEYVEVMQPIQTG